MPPGRNEAVHRITEWLRELLGGIFRDQQASIWQILLLFDNAETYPAPLPLPIAKIVVKVGALIGQLLGYKIEYEEYTTKII